MDALMFYKIAPSTEGLITHITSKRAFTTMYALMVCNIALKTAFSTMYIKLFIQSALVKTKTLKIRI